MERIILLGSKEGETVLDPFTGSGTTGVVAKRLKRNFIGFEINKEYYEMANNRINNIKVNGKAIYSEKLLKQDEQLKMLLEKQAKYNLEKN